ncbi:MAG: HEAT repeat domain-containing protein [Phycisphaerales bacterium]|jgi:HEAT repeat protein|nr:HEAT repeat domain-containing protein [Phycisphaerales bacterium]MBT7171077.1 HEAT repeat domain-containing protein [Phycisphaerales bacterium]
MKIQHSLCLLLALVASTVILGCDLAKINTPSLGFGQEEEKPDPDACTVNLDKAYVDARAALLAAASDRNPYVRSYAIEAISNVFGKTYSSALIQGLNDQATLVRFASAMACGKNKITSAKARLIQLVEDPATDVRVVCACIYALSQMDHTRFAPMLGFLVSGESDEDFPQGRAEAARAMGLMKHPTARKLLHGLLASEEHPAARLSMTEALARLGDRRAKQVLESYAHALYLDMRLVAIPSIARLRTPNATTIARRLTSKTNRPRIRIAAAGALGLLGDKSTITEAMYQDCARALNSPKALFLEFSNDGAAPKHHDVSSLQQLAARSLGWIGQKRALDILAPKLLNTDPAVTVMAAEATLTILGPRSLPLPRPKTLAAPVTWSPQPTRTLPKARPVADVTPKTDTPIKLHTAGAGDTDWK